MTEIIPPSVDGPRYVVWDDLGDNVQVLRERLSGMVTDKPTRLDLRMNRLPLEAVQLLVQYLRSKSHISACVGNNSFNFTDFYMMLVELHATDLMHTERLTLGFTGNEFHTDHLAAKALSEGRVFNLDDILEALDRLKTRQEKFAAMASWNDARHEVVRNRVLSLGGYNANGDNTIEYCVGDKVDDYMQFKLGYELEVRESRKALFNPSGEQIGELDGLLWYKHPKTGKKVAIMVTAKSHMNTAEFEKVHKTCNHWRRLIEEADQPESASWHIKYRHQCRIFKLLAEYDQLVAVGSPGMPTEIANEAKKLGYLVISHDTYQLENAPEWTTEHELT